MKTVLVVLVALVVGIVFGLAWNAATVRHLRQRNRSLRLAKSSENPALDKLSNREKAMYYQMLDGVDRGETPGPALAKKSILRSVTRFLFVTTQVFALFWVSLSYGIAAYSTIVLEQPFPVEELSRQAIITLLGMGGLKVVENIFEHNEGVVFGQSRAEGEEEGGVG